MHVCHVNVVIALALLVLGACEPSLKPGASETDGPVDGIEAEQACGRLDRIDEYVEAYEEMAVFDGVVLIAQDDRIVYHCSYGQADYGFGIPMRTDSRFRIASLSKQFTQAAIGRLVDEGLVSLDALLVEYLPRFPNAERITVGQLIEHTAGVAHTNRLAWMDMREALPLVSIVDGLAEEPLDFEPGSDDSYSNGGYALLAAVIEAVTNQLFEHYIETEIAAQRFPSVGHESPYEVVPGLVSRYAPGPVYGERVEASLYITSNRIGGGSLYSNAEDIWRFFRATYMGEYLSERATAALFPQPNDGDVLITGRAPGALAQVYMDFNTGLSVVTLSSNSGWPGSFNPDIVALYRGDDVSLLPVVLDQTPLTRSAATSYEGTFKAERFGWEVRVEGTDDGLVFVQDDVRTAFARTRSGLYHLPIYDWLCEYAQDHAVFTCRQRNPKAEIRFVFNRQG